MFPKSGNRNLPIISRSKTSSANRNGNAGGNTVGLDAAEDVADILKEMTKQEKYYRAIVFTGYMILFLLSLVYMVLNIIFILTIDYDFLKITLIAYFACRGGIYLVLVLIPYVYYSLQLNVINNPKDQKAIQNIMGLQIYRTNRELYHTPGYLYDRRDVRNSYGAFSLFLLVLAVTISTIWIYAITVSSIHAHQSGEWSNYVVNVMNYTDIIDTYNITLEDVMYKTARRELGTTVLPHMATCIVLHAYEAFYIYVNLHIFYRRAISPPASSL
jgi:hypothetical protein